MKSGNGVLMQGFYYYKRVGNEDGGQSIDSLHSPTCYAKRHAASETSPCLT